jgi:hypothetical protein
MASLQINTVPGAVLATALSEAANIAGQRGDRLCDITIDLTSAVVTVTDNRGDTGRTGQKH